MRKLTKKEQDFLLKSGITCAEFECKAKPTHWNEFPDDESEVFCAKHAKEVEAAEAKFPNYPPRNAGGTVKLPDCLLGDKRKLKEERHRRAEVLRTEALGPWLRSMFLTDVARLMDTLNISEEAARYRLNREMGIRHDMAVELSAPGARYFSDGSRAPERAAKLERLIVAWSKDSMGNGKGLDALAAEATRIAKSHKK